MHSGFVGEDNPYASSSQKGTCYFEFSRPLRTIDRLQQDVQFTIGQTSKISVAFWYPVDGNPWHGSGQYSISCDWVPSDIALVNSALSKVASTSSWDAANVFFVLISMVVIPHLFHLCMDCMATLMPRVTSFYFSQFTILGFENNFSKSHSSHNFPDSSSLEISSPKNHIFNKILPPFSLACNFHNFHDFKNKCELNPVILSDGIYGINSCKNKTGFGWGPNIIGCFL